jgi:membrane protein
VWKLFENSGFSMAGAVAFSFVLSLFPFCIFLAALASLFGGRELATVAVEQLFTILPEKVASALAPEIESVMGSSRVDLLTIGAFIALFFATSAIESLRAALNIAYKVTEKRSYWFCLAQSTLYVVLSAAGLLVLTWGIVVAPRLAQRVEFPLVSLWGDGGWLALATRYTIVLVIAFLQLLAYHFWLAAGRRTFKEVWPGAALSTALWILTARLFSSYLDFNDYSRFYAGLTQLMSALIFFQVSAMIVLLGAEVNRALIEAREEIRSIPRDPEDSAA